MEILGGNSHGLKYQDIILPQSMQQMFIEGPLYAGHSARPWRLNGMPVIKVSVLMELINMETNKC